MTRSEILLMAWLALIWTGVQAHDKGQFEGIDQATKEWYQGLMQPDNPKTSCCGVADAYWADKIEIRDGKTYVTITDDRPDEPLVRPHVPVGTVIEVPDYKLKWDKGNPTGHNILFITRTRYVYCFVQSTGI